MAGPGAGGDLADNPPGAVLVPPLPVDGQEHWPASAFGHGQTGCLTVRGATGIVDDVAALAGDRQRPGSRCRWQRAAYYACTCGTLNRCPLDRVTSM